MESATQPPQSPQQALSSIGTVVDVFSKGVAALAVALYASGFLIISLYQSEYGFSEVNPLRPKILAAGAWFLLFLSIPASSIARAKVNKLLTTTQLAQWLFPYYVGCMSAGLFTSFLFNYSLFPGGKAPAWWVWLIGIVASLALVIAINIWDKFPPRLGAVISVVLTLAFATIGAKELFIAHQFTVSAIGFWFFGVGVVTVVELTVLPKNVDWTRTVFTFCGALLVFAHYYYPHMKSSWGGGSPVPVTVYFGKESPIKPNQSATLQLVDESDSGFYLVWPKDNKAVLVPRNAISIVYFSDKPMDPSFMK
jgi:hypothetical protein